MEDLSKYSTEELEAMLQDSPQPQSAQPSQTQAPQATQEPASDMPDLSQYSTEALERMIGEQGTAEGRIEQMFNVGTDRRDEIDPLEEAAKGAGRAVKAIGGAFVGLGSGAVRLAGTPVRALTGWDGLHRVADSIDSGYEDWGSEALASELPDDDWGRVIGGFGEKMAGTAGSLGAMAAGGGLAKLGAAGKFGAASKAVGTAGAALQKSLPLMFGNDAAVRTYDTAKENGSGTARALGLASVNGAIHYFGFKAFENQSLNKMLGMPQEMGAMMPAWANAAMAKNAAGNTFTSLASGVRNGMYKYILAERAKGALKAGGIMGLQNFLSSVPTQMAEGAGVGDVDWGRAVSEGVGGVEEGALMEGLMGGAAALKTPKAARKFIADTYFRNGYKLPNGQHVPGLLHSEEGRLFVMKQNPEMQRRILDILDHGGKVTKGELNAACLPPDMTEAELREFAKNWKHDLEVEGWRKGEDEFLGDGEELTGSEDVRGQNAATTAAVEEERIAEEAMNADAPRNEPAPPIDAAREERAEPLSAAEAEAQQRQLNDAAERNRAEQVARDAEPRIAALRQTRQESSEMGNRLEHQFDEANAQADAERNGAEQLAREEAYPRITVEQSQAAGAETSPVANGGAGTALQEQIQRRIDAEARSEAGKKVQAEIDGFFDAVKGNRDVLGNEDFNARNADLLAEVDDAIRRNNPQMARDALNRLKKKVKNFAKKNRLRPATPEQPPEPPDGSEPSGGSKSNLLRRQQPRSATQSTNSLRPAATRDELNQQPKEKPNETGNVPVEAQPEPPVQDAGRGGQQQAPQAAERPVEVAAPRGEVPAAGEVADARPAADSSTQPATQPAVRSMPATAQETKPVEPKPVSKSDNGGQKLTGEVSSARDTPTSKPLSEMTNDELLSAITAIDADGKMEPDAYKKAIKPYKDEIARRNAIGRGVKPDEANDVQITENVSKRTMDDAFGDFIDENGKPKTISQLIDNGWRVEKTRTGAASRYRLVKDGVDGFHDLSSKKIKGRMRPGNYAWNIEAATKYSDSAEPPKSAPASAPRAEGTTTPPQSADAPQGAESAAGGATGGAAEGPKPTQGNKLRKGGGKKGKKLEAQAEKTPEDDGADSEEHVRKTLAEADSLGAEEDLTEARTGEAVIDRRRISDAAWVSDELRKRNSRKAEEILRKANALAEAETTLSIKGDKARDVDRWRVEQAKQEFDRSVEGLTDGVDFGRRPLRERVTLLKKPLVVDVAGGWDEADADYSGEDTKIKGKKVSPRVKAEFKELNEGIEMQSGMAPDGLTQEVLLNFAKEHGFDGVVIQGLHDPNDHSAWSYDNNVKIIPVNGESPENPVQKKRSTKLRTQAEADAAKQATQEAPAAPATQEATPEATAIPAPASDEQTQPASQFRDKNGNMKKTLRGAVERIASAIGNSTGKGAITPEEADGIVNGIAESPDLKHNRTRQFFTPLVTDAEWQNSLGVDEESSKNLRDAVVRARDASQQKKQQRKLDNVLRAADAGDKDAPTAYGLVRIASDALDKARTKGDKAAEARAQKALDDANAKFNAEYEQVPEASREKWVKEQEAEFQEWSKKHDDVARNESTTADAPIPGRDGSSTTMAEQLPAKGVSSGDDRGGFKLVPWEDGELVRGGRVNLEMRLKSPTTGKMLSRTEEMTRTELAKKLGKKRAADLLGGREILASVGAPESPVSRDAKFAADADYQRWLKSRKANDAEPLRQRYEMEQAKALGDAFKNAVRGVDVEYVGDRDYDPAKDNPKGGRELKDRDTGTVLGIFDRDTGKLKLFRGANWKTLNHELGGHATMRFAEQEAARGNRALLDKINEAVDGAMNTPLADEVRSRYPDADEATLRDEIWAALRERPSEAMQKYVKTLQGRKWYNRAWDAIKTAWRGILSRMGFNRADLSGIDNMTPDEFNEFLDKAMIGGKTLGKMEGGDAGNALRKAFIGPRGAKRLGIGKLDDAIQMEKDGEGRRRILDLTGWRKGKDGRWRIEIKNAKFSDGIEDYVKRNGGTVTILAEAAIDAPELFKAYPELYDVALEFTKLDGASGRYDKYRDVIQIDRNVRDKRRTLVHELQHFIQYLEGFEGGSNPKQEKLTLLEKRIPDEATYKGINEYLHSIASNNGYEKWYEKNRALLEKLNIAQGKAGHEGFDPFIKRLRMFADEVLHGEDKNAFDVLLPQMEKLRQKARQARPLDEEAFDLYWRNAGEVEARNAARRDDLDDPSNEFIRAPWITEDVPESEQIVRTGDGGGASESRGGRQSSVRMARGPVTPGPDVRIMDDEVKWLDRQGERFVDSTHNLRKVQSEVGYRDRSDPKSVGVEEVMDPKTGFVDWRKSSDIQKAIVKSNGFVQKNEHILQVRRDRATREMAKMKGLSEDAKRELVDDYLTALHAEERNRTIADRRGDTYNDDYAEGAGRSANWARDFIANDPNVQKYKAELDRIADIVHEAVVEDLRLRHENGLLSDDEYNFYSKKWKHYVPLRTDVTEGSPEGGAFNTSTATFNRSEYRTAKGRGADNIASSPFAFAFVQAHDGIGKSARNIIGNVTANFIDMTEAKGLNSTKVEVVAKDGSKSTKTEYRIAEVVPADVVKRGGTKFAATFADGTTAEIGSDMRLASHQDNLVLFKRPEPVIGKDGKPTGETAARLYVAKFTEGKNGRGLAVAKAITGKNMVEVPFWVQPFSKATHFLSRMNTSASPSFLTSNIFNDRNEAWRAMSARFGVLDGAKMAAKVWKYRYADGKDLKNWLENGELRPGSDVADFINGGAAIKGGNIAQGFSGETSSLKDNLARQERKARSWWERFKRVGRFENIREIASSVGDVVQSANELEELGTRYGVYHAVLDELVAKGVPREVAKAEAVTFCRGATTDFNVRGTLAPVIGSFYMFYNANVQGTRRNLQSLADKRGVQTFATLAGVASAMTVLRYWLGNDEEREKGGERNAKNALEYQKQSAMGIPIPSGRELSILKMRGVDALIPYAATKFTEAALYDDVSAMEALADSLKAVGGEALGVLGGNGVGNKSQISQTLAPSLADPFVQWATGTDWQGERRVKQLMDKTVPQSYNARHGTSDVFKWIAETVNDISGGNQYRKGVVDMAPEDVQLIVETLAGGLGRDITGAINTFSNVKEVAKGGSSERLFGRMPVVKSLVREYPDSTSRYFDALDEYNADKAEFKKTTELGRRAEMKKEHPYLTANKGRVDTLIERVQELTHRERGEVKVGQKWVPMKTELPEARKEAFRKRRLRLQAEVLRILGK